MKTPKVLFCDLDDTLIKTRTGKTFPQGIWDMEFKFDILDKIREICPEYLFIVTNQGGIGKFITEAEFEAKLKYIEFSIQSYIKSNKFKCIDSMYCPSMDKEDDFRKPNPGMLTYLCEFYNIFDNYSRDELLMIGDASDKVKNFSDTDRKTAENFGINYLDINDFKVKYFND